MAGVTRSLELFNAREQVLSSDVMRLQFLVSRDAQDCEASRSRSFDSNAPIPSGPGNLLQYNGTPISGLDEAPTLTGASGFTVTIGAGSGFLYNTGFAGLTSDDSPYLVVRWASGQVTHTTPDPSNPRIDVIVATPATVNSDQQSRTVLVDPTSRAITAQSVYKTANPSATLSIVSGTPAATPLVPAVPTGALPLFYVYVPAAAGSAASFAQCRASWRRLSYPLAAMSGVVCGLGLRWDLTANPASANSKISTSGLHRVVIDGEALEFVGTLDSTNGGVVTDTGNSPFAAAAPSTWNRPYYLYAVGGRHNPMPSLNTGSGTLSPITLVESTVVPDIATGKPTANLTVRGQTIGPAGAVYVGLGMVAATTSFRAGCIMSDEWTFFGSSILGANSVSLTKTNNLAESFSAPPSGGQIGFPTDALVTLNYATSSSTQLFVYLRYDGGGGSGAVSPQFARLGLAACGTSAFAPFSTGIVAWPGPGEGTLWATEGQSGDVLGVRVYAYRHRVRMFGMTGAP